MTRRNLVMLVVGLVFIVVVAMVLYRAYLVPAGEIDRDSSFPGNCLVV